MMTTSDAGRRGAIDGGVVWHDGDGAAGAAAVGGLTVREESAGRCERTANNQRQPQARDQVKDKNQKLPKTTAHACGIPLQHLSALPVHPLPFWFGLLTENGVVICWPLAPTTYQSPPSWSNPWPVTMPGVTSRLYV